MIKLSLGPILYYWPRQTVLAFYERMAASPVDIVYLGETVCAKRKEMRTGDWISLADELAASGKQVVLSTLALLEAQSDLLTLRRICDNERFLVEANDMAAVQLLRGRPFVAGPGINLYNQRSLAVLARLGLRRWVLPVELSAATLAAMQESRPDGVETEVFAYGRLPLAYSARCFTARAYNLPKDDCQYRCLQHPDGLEVKTQDEKEFLALNGIQTQSADTFNLIGMLDDLKTLAVDVVRLSPQSQHMERIIDLFHRCLSQPGQEKNARRELETLVPLASCHGYWYGEAGTARRG